MSEGSMRRQALAGLAWVILSTAFTGSGCARIPVPRSISNQVHLPPPSEGKPELASSVNETNEVVVIPSLPPLPPLEPLPDSEIPSAPTPLLDAALARANAQVAEERELREAEASLEDPKETKLESKDSSELPPLETTEIPAKEPQPRSDATRDSEANSGTEPEPTASPVTSGLSTGSPKGAADPKAVALSSLSSTSHSTKAPAIIIDPEKKPDPVDPRILWDEGIARLQKLAIEQAKRSNPIDWTQRSRLLEVIARNDRHGNGKGTDEPSRACRLALAALGIPYSDEAEPRGPEIQAAIMALESEAPLEIGELKLCRKVDGFGNYEPLDTSACKSGQHVIIYCEMLGLHYAQAGELFQSRLSSRVEITPASGGDPIWSQPLPQAEDICRRRRRDYYVNYRFELGPQFAPGSYELRLIQTDEIANRTASSSIPLTILP